MVAQKSLGTFYPGVAIAQNLANLFGSWTHSSNKLSSGSQTLIYPSSLNKHSLASLNGSRHTGSKVKFLEWHFNKARASFLDSLGCLVAMLLEFLLSSYLIISFLHLSKLTQKKIRFSIAGTLNTLDRSKSTCYPLYQNDKMV